LEYNPRIVEALSRTARASAETSDFVATALDAIWPRLARREGGAVVCDGAVWPELAPALRSEAIRRAYAAVAGEDTLGLGDVERALGVIGGPAGKRVELPGGVTVITQSAGSFTVGRDHPADADPHRPSNLPTFQPSNLPAD
jgi:hypothetical protein